jgi:tetratricopeptide (TPR) repeat protein
MIATADQATTEIVALLRAGKMDEAVTHYTQYREDLGYLLVNRAGTDPQMQKVVANLLYRARDYDKAASCCENLGEHEKAAALYALAENYPLAAEMFMQIGQPMRAAEMFEKARNYRYACQLYVQIGDKLRAAQCAERAGELLRAGTLLAEQKRAPQALEVLQKIKRTEPDYPEATALIARLLEESGHADLAARKRHALHSDDTIETVEAEPIGSEVVSVMEGFEFLKQLPLFETLSLADMRAFYHRCETVNLAAGDVLIRQGVPGEALFVLTVGALEVRKIAASGEGTVVARLPVGSYVGEMGLVDDSPTSAEVRASANGSALRIGKRDFEQLLGASDRLALSIYRVFVKTLTERLRATTARVA